MAAKKSFTQIFYLFFLVRMLGGKGAVDRLALIMPRVSYRIFCWRGGGDFFGTTKLTKSILS